MDTRQAQVRVWVGIRMGSRSRGPGVRVLPDRVAVANWSQRSLTLLNGSNHTRGNRVFARVLAIPDPITNSSKLLPIAGAGATTRRLLELDWGIGLGRGRVPLGV